MIARAGRRLLARAVAVALVAGCGAGPSRELILSRDLVIHGRFAPGEDAQGFLLSDDGARVRIDDFRFDPATGAYDFAIPAEAIRADGALTELERVTALDDAAPQTTPARLADATLGSLTFELAPLDAGSGAAGGFAAYARVVAEIPRSAAFAADKDVERDVAPVDTAGRIVVQVLDDTGVPIEGARVFAVALDLTDPARPRPLRPWEADMFRPVATKTDGSGLAAVFPVPSAASGRAFQLVAQHLGHCVQTTGAIAPNAPTVPIKLAACAPSTAAATTPDLDVTLATTTLSRAEDGGRVALVRGTGAVDLDVRLRNLALSGLAVRVYAGDAATGAALAEVLYETIPPQLRVDVPAVLAGGEADGPFAIGVTPIRAGKDVGTTVVLRGSRNSVQPVAKAARFEAPAVLSGLPGATFVVKALDCVAGLQLGVHLGATAATAANAQFYPCDKAGNTVPLSAFTVAGAGAETLRFFLRDEYGNESASVTDGSNAKAVLIDATAPVLADDAPALSVDFGFAATGERVGTDASPYVFQKGTTDLLRLDPAGITNVVLRFANPSACMTEAAAGQDAADPRDLALASLTLMPRTGPARVLACGADLPVNELDLTFPAANDADATLKLVGTDLGGNASEPHVYMIPPCATAGVEGVCWER